MTSKALAVPLLISALACSSAPAWASEYLADVTSEVYQVSGTPKEIALKASTCISQNLKPSATDAHLVTSSDLDGGTIVARNAISYHDRLIQWEVRSTFTFEAREGRFRIVQTNLERFNKRWGPIGKWTGSGWKKADEAFRSSADKVAQCVTSASNRANW